jgi:hypothetical protein
VSEFIPPSKWQSSPLRLAMWMLAALGIAGLGWQQYQVNLEDRAAGDF